jgi:hypothetical protein
MPRSHFSKLVHHASTIQNKRSKGSERRPHFKLEQLHYSCHRVPKAEHERCRESDYGLVHSTPNILQHAIAQKLSVSYYYASL